MLFCGLGNRPQKFCVKKGRIFLEAATGFEPVNNGFADRRLTTWLCRLKNMEQETGFEPAAITLAT